MTAISSSTVLDCVALGAVSKLAAQPVLAAKALWMGQFVCAVTASGFMSDPDFATTGCVLGVAESDSAAVAGESSGDRGVNLLCGMFWRPNFATRPVTLTDIGKACFATDNYTVGNTSTDGPVAGIVCGLDATMGVLVYVHPGLNYLLSQATLESNLASVNAGLGANLIGFQDSGNKTTGATVDAVLDELLIEATSTQGVIEIPLGSITDADGDFTKFANAGADGLTIADSKAVCFRINNAASPPKNLTSFPIPYDADITANMTLKFLCSKSGATVGDATTITVEAFNQVAGATHDADGDYGGATGALVGDAIAKTTAVLSRTLALANLPAAGSSVSITFKPTDGTLGTDDLLIHRMWVEYKRKPRTA